MADTHVTGWAEQYDEEGNSYFYNVDTFETVWEVPTSSQGGYWKQLWDDHHNAPFYQHTLSRKMVWTLEAEGTSNSSLGNMNHASEKGLCPEATPRTSFITYEEANPSSRSHPRDTVDKWRKGRNRLSVGNVPDDKKVSTVRLPSFEDVHKEEEELELELEGIDSDSHEKVIDIGSDAHDLDSSSSSEGSSEDSEEIDLVGPGKDNETSAAKVDDDGIKVATGSPKMTEKELKSEGDDGEEVDEEDEDDDEDDDTIFYVYQCVFFAHGCLFESPAAGIECLLKFVFQMVLVVISGLFAAAQCFADAAIIRIKNHAREASILLASAVSLLLCIPGGLVYRDFNSFQDDFDLLPIWTVIGRVDPRRLWVFTHGQGADALNVISHHYPADSMDEMQAVDPRKKGKYNKVRRSSNRKSKSRRKSSSSGKKSKTAYSVNSDQSNFDIEMVEV